MRHLLRIVPLLLIAVMSANAQPIIHYTLGMSNPPSHFLEVEFSLTGLASSEQTVDIQMPAWRTGRYMIFDFAGGVVDFSAMDGAGKAIAWEKTDKQTWRLSKGSATGVTAKYKVYANEFNMRTRGLNDEHAFVDPASAFMYSPKHQAQPLTLTVKPYGTWHVTTGLDAVPGKKNEFSAPSFEYFADCPIEVGNHKDIEFDAEGVKHIWMIFGEGNYDAQKLIEDGRKIVKANKELWGRLPYQKFIFMLHVSPSAGGGTEHINSTIMGTRPFTFKNPDSYKGFLGLVSHEYFHTWNVKQLRPAGITPYDFSKENYTQELWLAEGGTDFYGGIIMLRAGMLSADEILGELAGMVRDNRQRPGNRMQSVTESSFDAWVKYWRNTQQSYNTEADYYSAGSQVTAVLNLELLKRTGGKKSMDDVLRSMFEKFPLGKRGYTVEDLRSTCEDFGGGSFKEFFAKHIYGTEPLPWEDALSVAGLVLKPKDDARPSLGVQMSDAGDRPRIFRVFAGGAGAAAGLDVSDEIVALNGYRVRTQDVIARVGDMKAGDEVELTVFRDDRLRTIHVKLLMQAIPSYTVTRIENPTATQKASYERMLGVAWPEGGK
ncbi:MAG: hypothetical protein A3C56_07935 [Ignavibacteria bacterium RIFCSPHIGHO2_02_FULL_56_12]|nr:MAG: hypothetical protein A3C56_07935 [Ignavibacteria bacterium RIFCSPHIGHO2_02_FULL_56_12]